MRIRSFVIAYAFVLAILLFADRRPGSAPSDRYSHVIDLTAAPAPPNTAESATRIIAPDAIIPGTWAAGQIPAERLVAPLVVIDLGMNPASASRISLGDIAAWETKHGMIPQGAVVAIRRKVTPPLDSRHPASESSATPLPINRDAAQFLSDARYAIGFAVEAPVDLSTDRTLARQLALHGSYVLESTASFTSLPPTGSLLIVAPAKNEKRGETPVRVLAMVR
jgi:kynurenine formamidase